MKNIRNPVSEQWNKREAGQLPFLFSPFTIGKMTIKNRLAMAPIGEVYSPMDGAIRQEFCDFILARAQGGVGMIILADAGMGFTVLDVKADSRQLEKLIAVARNLVRKVHDQGVRIGVQLHHSGRQLDFPVPGYQLVGPSAIPWSKRVSVPNELSEEEIEELIARYVEAALFVKNAEFDFLEVKACHGYLLSSFISPHSNKRTDQYGGNLRGRAKFPLEIIKRIKEQLGDDLLISCRFNGSDNVHGGIGLDESISLAHLLIEQGVDFLNVTAGVYGSYPVIVPPYDTPHGCYVPLAETIKKAVSVPIIAVGRINDPLMAEEILRTGKADVIAMGRALLADPDLPNKAKRGEFDEIRKCIACNQGCQDRVAGIGVTCLVNPSATRERVMTIIPAQKVKKVLVIGGGVAGMEAARVAALRGHKVILYDEDHELGGQWKLASIPQSKEEFAELTKYLNSQLRKLQVELHLGTRFTSKMIEVEKPDVVILATGARPIKPKIPGANSKNVFMARDILKNHSQSGKEILVIGGNALGLEVAAFLAAQGERVVVIEMEEKYGKDLGPTVRWHLLHHLSELQVEILASTRVMKIDGRTVVLKNGQGQELRKEVDSIVIAVGSKSIRRLENKIKEKIGEVYIIGDAVKPRNGLFAMREGAEAGLKI